MLTILACIFVFGILVTVHEFGHFITAKLTGMKVEEFSIGFGPNIYQQQEGETLYSLRMLPLGGYNKIAGMDPDDPDDPERGFNAKPVSSRMLVILAGSLMNILLPVLIFFGLFLAFGMDVPENKPVLGQIIEGYPAEQSGLKEGDRILSINGKPVHEWLDIRKNIADSGMQPIPFEIQRDTEKLTITVTPGVNPETGKPFIGVVSSLKNVRLTPVQAVVASVTATKNIIKNMYASLYHMVTGKTKAEFSGPVGVAKMAGEVAHKGFDRLMQFTAMLSLNLAIINLLPLPALDGGHFLILLIEAVTGHKLGKTAMQNIQKVGVAMILALTIFATPVAIGGDAPVAVQSMTNTKTQDAKATLEQIHKLADAGCDIIRCAVPDMDAALALKEIVQGSPIPVIADIHFDYRLALQAIESGVHGLRLNPGNIGGTEKVKAVVEAAKPKNIPIRIGVNAGSLPKDLLETYGHPTAEALVEAAWRHIRILEEMDYRNIKISLKCHDVPLTLAAYRLLASQCDYPLHVGITEAGTVNSGIIKSAVGIGTLLAEGIGDTIRVSLTGDPVNEVKVGFEILKSLGLRSYGPTLISCPTCGRTSIDLEKLAAAVEARLADIKEPISVAVMGCIVNGPGEAREADVGIAGGKGEGLVFRKGQVIKKVPEACLVNELFDEIDKILVERENQ